MSLRALELVGGFVNTLDVDTGEDAIATPAALAGWLSTQGLCEDDVRATGADVQRAAELREALLAHLLANDGAPLPEDAVAVLDRQARRSQVVLGFERAGAHLESGARGVDGALGGVLVRVAETMADGSWSRLKVCRAEDCRWAFVDRSRNSSRHWCAMGVCGNRQKARTYRARHAR
jgi:predicted RNA-binding Zn ribbon-like protein